MRDSKMTVSTSHLWKSAAAAVRQPSRARERNLHIGKTLQDLYPVHDMPAEEGRLALLLQELEAVEKKTVRK